MSASADSSAAILGLRPGGAVHGELRVPGSKSIAQRVLLAAAVSSGSTQIAGLPDGDDVTHALALVESCGVLVQRLAPRAVRITGKPPGPHRGLAPRGAVEVGESGTLARLATAVLALCGHAGAPIEIHAHGTLRSRKSTALFRALSSAGVELTRITAAVVEPTSDAHVPDRWPVRLVPLGPPSTLSIRDPSSSQEVSALLLAIAAYPDAIDLVVHGTIPSRPYLELSCDVLARFGARIERNAGNGVERFHVRGPLTPSVEPYTIEADASSAAVALAAACISGGELRVPGLGRSSRQGDVRIVEHLRAFGCDADAGETSLGARGLPSRTVDLDLTGEPDLAPVLAAVAAALAMKKPHVGSTTRLRGLGTLQGKESARISVLAEGLSALGLAVEASDEQLVIGPGSGARREHEVVLDPHGDHRMAFAFALMGLCVDGVRVRDAGCVAKSWPTFWRDIERAGAPVSR